MAQNIFKRKTVSAPCSLFINHSSSDLFFTTIKNVAGDDALNQLIESGKVVRTVNTTILIPIYFRLQNDHRPVLVIVADDNAQNAAFWDSAVVLDEIPAAHLLTQHLGQLLLPPNTPASLYEVMLTGNVVPRAFVNWLSGQNPRAPLVLAGSKAKRLAWLLPDSDQSNSVEFGSLFDARSPRTALLSMCLPRDVDTRSHTMRMLAQKKYVVVQDCTLMDILNVEVRSKLLEMQRFLHGTTNFIFAVGNDEAKAAESRQSDNGFAWITPSMFEVDEEPVVSTVVAASQGCASFRTQDLADKNAYYFESMAAQIKRGFSGFESLEMHTHLVDTLRRSAAPIHGQQLTPEAEVAYVAQIEGRKRIRGC